MMKATSFLIVALAVLVLSSGAAQAQTSGAVLDANVPDGGTWDWQFFEGQKKWAQTFVARNSGRLTDVSFKVKPYSRNTTYILAEILTPPTSENPARVMAEARIPSSSLPYQAENGGMVTASFDSSTAPPVSLIAGREYALRLSAPSPGAYWIEQYSYPNSVYPEGKLCDASNNTVWGSCSGGDGVFAVYVVPGSTDSTPPTIEVSRSPAPNTSGWNSADFDVDLIANDVGGTGVERITYSADGTQRLLPTFVSGSRASLRITGEGETTITYSARDRAGNESPDQTLTVRLDKSEPQTIVESGPDGPTNDTTPTFTFSGWDNIALPEELHYSYRLDDGEWSTYSTDTSATMGEGASLEDGAHTLQVRSMDLAGNVDATPVGRTFTVDTAPPSANASTSPAPNSTGWHSGEGYIWINLNGGDNVGIEEVVISISGAGAADFPSGAFSGDSIGFSLWREGFTTISYFATDRAGNSSPEQELTVKIDRTDPDGLASGPSGPTNDATPTFRFVGEDNLTASEDLLFSYRVDGGGEWSPFSAKTTATLGGEAELTDGRHVLYLRIKDQAGNVGGSFPRDFVVDTVAPDTRIFSGPARFTDNRSAVFEVGLSERGNAECRLDGSRFGACPPSLKYTELADGEHVFKVRAVDEAGNADSTPASYRWMVDTAAPEGDFEINGGDRMTRTRMVELVLNALDPSPASGISSVRIRNEDGAWSDWRPYGNVKPWRLSAGVGEKTVYVQFRDRAGNQAMIVSDTIGFDRSA